MSYAILKLRQCLKKVGKTRFCLLDLELDFLIKFSDDRTLWSENFPHLKHMKFYV